MNKVLDAAKSTIPLLHRNGDQGGNLSRIWRETQRSVSSVSYLSRIQLSPKDGGCACQGAGKRTG